MINSPISPRSFWQTKGQEASKKSMFSRIQLVTPREHANLKKSFSRHISCIGFKKPSQYKLFSIANSKKDKKTSALAVFQHGVDS